MDPHRLYDQNKDNLLIHIEQTQCILHRNGHIVDFIHIFGFSCRKYQREGFFLNITKGRGAIFEIELDWKVGEG